MIQKLNGKTPKVDPSAFIAPDAVVLGDVEIGPETSIWYTTVLRGDINFIRIGAQSNIQDGSIVHVDHLAGQGVTIGDRVLVGHRAIVHSCTLEDDCFIGMGATIMGKAVVEAGAMVGAGAVVAPGKVIPAGWLAVGVPAKPLRQLSEEELIANRNGVKRYLTAMRLHLDQSLVIDLSKEA